MILLPFWAVLIEQDSGQHVVVFERRRYELRCSLQAYLNQEKELD